MKIENRFVVYSPLPSFVVCGVEDMKIEHEGYEGTPTPAYFTLHSYLLLNVDVERTVVEWFSTRARHPITVNFMDSEGVPVTIWTFEEVRVASFGLRNVLWKNDGPAILAIRCGGVFSGVTDKVSRE